MAGDGRCGLSKRCARMTQISLVRSDGAPARQAIPDRYRELGKVLHGRLQKSKIRRREGLKGLQSYIRPVGAGCSSCWP